jgi:hypothetical protein
MEYEEKKEVKEGKIYNLFRCGYLEVREWLKETDIVIIPLGSMEQRGGKGFRRWSFPGASTSSSPDQPALFHPNIEIENTLLIIQASPWLEPTLRR